MMNDDEKRTNDHAEHTMSVNGVAELYYINDRYKLSPLYIISRLYISLEMM